MSGGSDSSVDNIDFGGRFAKQFFNNELNPITSTPVASDNSFCESGYDSFNHAFKSLDINNNIIATPKLNTTTHSNINPSVIITGLDLTNDSANVIQRQQRSQSLFTSAPPVSNEIQNARITWNNPNLQEVYQRIKNVDKIEEAASRHRSAASFSEPQYTWSGQLPCRSYKNPVYSCKVFLGGVPWDVTEEGLIDTFGRFGSLRVQWPGRDTRQQRGQTKAGYVYLIYESERYVKSLLAACTQDFGSGTHPEKYFYQLSSRRMRFKEVQVIPWINADSNYIRHPAGRPDMHKTVFVGALHGMMTAEGLAKVMNDLFGGVAYVGIDTDKHKYPIGSGRVTFQNHRSYLKAVNAGFVEIKSPQFNKKIQMDPYLEPSDCSTCHVQPGPYHCRDCLRYYCKTCWDWRHSTQEILGRMHRPLMRKKREA